MDKKICLARTGLTGEGAGGAQLFCEAYADETQLHHDNAISVPQNFRMKRGPFEQWYWAHFSFYVGSG